MSITILQQPLDFTPSNAQHIYTAVSTLTGSTDFRYVFDVWLNPRTGPEKVGRVVVSPNTYGVGIVDVSEIVRNYIKPNPRDDKNQSTGVGFNNTDAIPNGLLINASRSGGTYYSVSLVQSNAFNSNYAYEELIHVGEYKVLIGEQYTNTTGGTTVDICEEPWYVQSTLQYSLSDGPAVYTGSPNTINITNASTGVETWASGTTGWYYEHYTSGLTLVASGSTTGSSGSYIAALEPDTGDIVYIFESGSGKRWAFQWNIEPGTTGWILVNIYTPPCADQPDFITIWPGIQENKTNFNYQNLYWSGNTNGQENFKYWEGEQYRFQTLANITSGTPAQFLTTFGPELYTSTLTNGSTTSTIDRVRRRYHHPDCPVVVSYFLKSFQDQVFSGTSGLALDYFNYASTWDAPYSLGVFAGRWTLVNNGAGYSGITTETKNRIMYDVLREGVDYGSKVAYWKHTGTGSSNALSTRVSEVVEYYFFEANCMSDPQHFLFLNDQGVWDTYTFDRKNIKTVNKESKFYGQGTLRNSPVYNPFFYSQRDTIFDQDVLEVVEAQSDFMYENDRKIVEQLFRSTSVYLIKDYISPVNPQPQYSLTPYLIPIVITNTSLQEFKQRYNKLFQYTLTYRYNPNQLYRSNL